MKITKNQLRQIIKEELASALYEAASLRGTHALGGDEGELELAGDIPINVAGGRLAGAPWNKTDTAAGFKAPKLSAGMPTFSATALPGKGIDTSAGGKINPYLQVSGGSKGLQGGAGVRVSGENKPTFEVGAEGTPSNVRGKFSLAGRLGGATMTTPSTGGDKSQFGVHVNPLELFKGKKKSKRTEPENDWSDVDDLFGEGLTDDETAVNETLERWKKLING
jgi:hypothetical protein